MDMSAAYARGVALALPNAAIRYDPFHMIALAIQAMDEVGRQELNARARASGQRPSAEAPPGGGETCPWGMRKKPLDSVHALV